MLASDTGALQQAKLVLLGDMGAGKSSLVLRFVKGQFFDYQACPSPLSLPPFLGRQSSWCRGKFWQGHTAQPSFCREKHRLRVGVQESTIGAAFLTKTMPEHNVKFEIWYVPWSVYALRKGGYCRSNHTFVTPA